MSLPNKANIRISMCRTARAAASLWLRSLSLVLLNTPFSIVLVFRIQGERLLRGHWPLLIWNLQWTYIDMHRDQRWTECLLHVWKRWARPLAGDTVYMIYQSSSYFNRWEMSTSQEWKCDEQKGQTSHADLPSYTKSCFLVAGEILNQIVNVLQKETAEEYVSCATFCEIKSSYQTMHQKEKNSKSSSIDTFFLMFPCSQFNTRKGGQIYSPLHLHESIPS